MSIKVGPFIGVSDTQAKIWLKSEPNVELDIGLTLQPSGGQHSRIIPTSEHGIGIADFTGLKPNSIYSYRIKHDSANWLPTPTNERQFATFPKPKQDQDLAFVFFSCHKPEFSGRGAGVDVNTMIMWDRLSQILASASAPNRDEAPRFILALGDQIYCDDLWKRRNRRTLENATHGELVQAYSEVYDSFLGLQQIQRVTARCPVFMTWDDHEIRDGWGSSGDEESAFAQRMFKAASETYHRYQLSHNPHVTNPDRRYYAFRYGKIGFLVLDLRGHRSATESILLGDQQWDWLEDWLQNEAPKCRVVFIVCSVPFIHLTHQVTKLRFKWLGKVFMKVFGLADDFVDQWNSRPFIKEATRLAEMLFELAGTAGIRFVMLGGDVHVGTFAVLRSYRENDQFHPAIYQFTSSPISNKPTWIAKYLRLFAPEIELRPDLPFRGRLLKIIPERNFGLVRVRKHPETSDYAITLEVHSQEAGVQKFATLW